MDKTFRIMNFQDPLCKHGSFKRVPNFSERNQMTARYTRALQGILTKNSIIYLK